jgi:hypothetical protein
MQVPRICSRVPSSTANRGGSPSYPGYRLFRCVLALAALETGRRDEALAIATQVVHGGDETLPYHNSWAYGMATLAEVVARTGDRDLAAVMYDKMLPFAHLMATAGGEIAGGSRSLAAVAVAAVALMSTVAPAGAQGARRAEVKRLSALYSEATPGSPAQFRIREELDRVRAEEAVPASAAAFRLAEMQSR